MLNTGPVKQKSGKTRKDKIMEITQNIENSAISTIEKRLGSCEVCDQNEAKYTCPRCELKTCCLECSKIHKKELECSGIRDVAKFIPIKKMSTTDFMNDYYFLEEATRFTKNIKSNPKVNGKSCHNFKFLRLKKEAFKRNVKLFLVNNGLSRRKRNYSAYKSQDDTIFWYTELIFPNAENLRLTRKFDERKQLHELIESVFETTKNNERLSKMLEFYRAEGVDNLRCLLKAEGLKRSNKRFYKLELEDSLNSNLNGKVIIEFPTIYVLLKHSADDFEIVDTDDDDETQNEIKNFRQTLHSEVLSKKVGENPPVAELRPEEVPLIAKMFTDEDDSESKIGKSSVKRENLNKVKDDADEEILEGIKYSNQIIADEGSDMNENDEEIQPQNYFF